MNIFFITSEEKKAKASKEYFVNIVPNLGINACNVNEITTSDTNSLTTIINKYRHHPSIKTIKDHLGKIKSLFSVWMK